MPWLTFRGLTTPSPGKGMVQRDLLFIRDYQECKVVPPLWISVWQFPIKFNTHLPYDPAIPLLCIL